MDYRYNIRGWLTSINNYTLSNDNGVTNNDAGDLFGMNLSYNQEAIDINGTSTQKLYDGRITAARWSSNNLKDPVKERVYGYGYDAQQRFSTAKYAGKNGTLWDDEPGMYDLSASAYDDNGNIISMQRYSKAAGVKTPIDDLTYVYGSNGNQLTEVTDASGNNFGYPDHTSGISPELEYDKSGNLTSDLNSEVTSVVYNFLNLPIQALIDIPNTSNDHSIEYQYDATGYVIKKTYKKGGIPVRVVDYIHGIQYYDAKLSLIFTSEGRASAYRGGFEYEYFLKDHLSNIRVVFGYMHDTDVFKATMEDELAAEEGGQFKNLDASRSFEHNHTNASLKVPLPDRSSKLNGYNSGNIVGPAKMLQVKSGDNISMEVYARYTTAVSSNDIVTTLASAVTNAFQLVDGEQAFEALESNIPIVSGDITRKLDAPKAYMFYILFDKNYVYKQFGYAAVEDDAIIAHQLLALDITVPNDGYMYIYVANESIVSEATAVYFDDFTIIHHKTTSSLRVTEVNDYDPYGLVLEGTRYVDESRIDNNYKYQGEFAELESWTGWTRFEGRGNYDGRIGRWHSPDPLTQFMSPYSAMANSPTSTVDPDGRFVWFAIAGAVAGGTVGGIIAHSNGEDWYKGAIVGAFIGASMGMGVSSSFGASGIFSSTGQLTQAWGLMSTAINGANVNMLASALNGGDLDNIYKSGLVGAASSLFTATGGFGLAKHGLPGKLAYQSIGTSARSVGNNWAMGRDPLSRVTLGLGPVNLTLGKGQRLLQWQNNIGNIAMNTFGLINTVAGGSVRWDWNNLTPIYKGGLIDKFADPADTESGFSPYVITGNSNVTNTGIFAHEVHHLWQSRAMGDMFAADYLMQGISGMILNRLKFSTSYNGIKYPAFISPTLNYYETIPDFYPW